MREGKGKLYICPTPIGNLEDITLRVLRVLQEADVIAAEDTRHSIKLLNHYDIQKPLTSYHEHNKGAKGNHLIEKLKAGETIALVSDAGMPGISDPGADLIKLCIEHDMEFEVLPGATAFTTALVASGLPTNHFAFEGFLDREKKNRKKRLEFLQRDDRTMIFYEAPHRLVASLKDIHEMLGNRNAVAARELTKRHEEYIRGTIEALITHFEEKPPKGEFVILVEGMSQEAMKAMEEEKWEQLSIKDHLHMYIDAGMNKKEAVKKVAKERGLGKREVYEESIDL
ncbi:16S rRNA (cytidine(1402)-2'-O)-methyltransferase [Anaerosolibacter carboniphilus]|nr:16S rRNA (cytidine(1402)-2'-O)-methyltransferase [Anaerosolibacter carboniphilus]